MKQERFNPEAMLGVVSTRVPRKKQLDALERHLKKTLGKSDNTDDENDASPSEVDPAEQVQSRLNKMLAPGVILVGKGWDEEQQNELRIARGEPIPVRSPQPRPERVKKSRSKWPGRKQNQAFRPGQQSNSTGRL
jgi:hypothetical protein